jgi:LPXTG-motif cell wall-anchored protein
MRRLMLVVGVVLIGSLGLLAQPAGAQATSPYVGGSTVVPATDPVSTVAPAAAAADVSPASTTQGSLPVTGSDVAGLVGIAVILIAAGTIVLIVRRRTDRKPAGLAAAG